jgi:hypothetical protein
VTCAHGMPTPASCVECMEDGGLGAPARAPLTVEATFKARYDGQCPGCNLPIVVGQVVHRLSNDSYVHQGCQP